MGPGRRLLYSRRATKQEYDELGHNQITAKLYKIIDSDHKIIADKLKTLGFSDKEISDIELYHDSNDFRGEDGKHTDTKVTVRGKIAIESDQVFAIQKLDSAMSSLMAEGITVATGKEKYHFSKLNDIKPEMIRDAMGAARVAAKGLAGNTGVKLGRIKNASQGRFSIVDKGENYGDTDRTDKKNRVVTQIKIHLDS